MAKKVFPLLAEFSSIDEAHEKLQGENKELFEKWLKMKSEKTTEDFLSLDEEGKESIIDYLSEFEAVEEKEPELSAEAMFTKRRTRARR